MLLSLFLKISPVPNNAFAILLSDFIKSSGVLGIFNESVTVATPGLFLGLLEAAVVSSLF